jgi:hypothetical protein
LLQREPISDFSQDARDKLDDLLSYRVEGQMTHAFAIVPDGENRPTAFFQDLEDATEWALEKYGSDRFAIRYFSYVTADQAQAGN